METLNNNSLIKEIESVLEDFTVMLNLSYSSRFEFSHHENRFKMELFRNYDYYFNVQDVNNKNYVVRVLTYDDHFDMILIRSKFKTNLYNHHCLEGMPIHIESGLASPDESYWHIQGKKINDLNKVTKLLIKLLNKKERN